MTEMESIESMESLALSELEPETRHDMKQVWWFHKPTDVVKCSSCGIQMVDEEIRL